MINEISRFLTGFVKAEIKGEDCSRFLSAMAKSGIGFWNFNSAESGRAVTVSMHISDYKKVVKMRRRFGVTVRRIKKRGLPFILSPYRKRPGLIAGFILGLTVAFIMSGRVWVLTSGGSLIHKEAEVLEKAADAGIYIGAKRSDIDPHAAANKLMLLLEGTDWVSVNTDGVSVDIEIKDSEQKPEIYESEDNTVQNVVAKKSGIIRSIEAQDGMITVKVGEGVKQGDLLITGLWDTYDKWGVKTGKSFSAAARGKVIAEVYEELCYSVKLTDTVYYDGEESCGRWLSFFTFKIPLSFPMLKNGEYQKSVSESPLWLLGVKMPVSIITESYTEQIKATAELTETEAETRLREMLSTELKERIKLGSELLSKKESFILDGNTLYLKAECTFLEDIAEEQAVLFENSEKDE